MSKSKLAIIALALFINAGLLTSCSSDDKSNETVNNKANRPESGFDPKAIGYLHNKAMSHLHLNWKDNLTDPKNLVESLSGQEASSLNLFFNEFVNIHFPKYKVADNRSFYKAALTTNTSYRKEYLDKYSTSTDAYEIAPVLFKREKSNVMAQINTLNENNIISKKETAFIKNTLNEFENIESAQNYFLYSGAFKRIEDDFDKNNFDLNNGEGILASILLEVAKSSHEYWTITFPGENDPSQPPYTTMALPVWAGLDAVGALAGAASSLWSQRNNKDTDWWDVGGQAVIWGAAGSVVATRGFGRLFVGKK